MITVLLQRARRHEINLFLHLLTNKLHQKQAILEKTYHKKRARLLCFISASVCDTCTHLSHAIKMTQVLQPLFHLGGTVPSVGQLCLLTH